jgi:hypothetical protein
MRDGQGVDGVLGDHVQAVGRVGETQMRLASTHPGVGAP